MFFGSRNKKYSLSHRGSHPGLLHGRHRVYFTCFLTNYGGIEFLMSENI